MFDTVLIANRGEIATRAIRTLRRLGIRSVAVYSDADAGALHVRLADEAVRLGPASAAQSYLNIEAVIAAAKRTRAQAIHPGYGFLAENAAFAEACEAAGIVFIGPRPSAIRVMGDKISAKLAVAERDVPTVPGVTRPGLSDDELIAEGADVGFPLLIKPSAGGGGKGMHVVTGIAELPAAVAAARREAAASFGDDTLFLERYVKRPRHIEVQMLADGHGHVVHLGERECSLQRRHQKVIEEAPSALLDEATRARIGQAAVDTAKSVDYLGVGTVEFIVSADKPDEFFFMEMNTRLQVEHPVTEQVTGFDLVEQQLRIAAGEPLAFAQDDVVLTGHSFEARLYAEDPRSGFLPTGGRVDRAILPGGEGIRVDSALADGLDISVDYDPMLAKIISTGSDRDDARRKLVAALRSTAVLGFTTNIEFLGLLLDLPAVAGGDLDTGLIERAFPEIEFTDPSERHFAEAALLIHSAQVAPPLSGPWLRADGWRLGPAAPSVYRLVAEHAEPCEVRIWGPPARAQVSVAGADTVRASIEVRDGLATVTLDGLVRTFAAKADSDSAEITDRGASLRFAVDAAVHHAGAEAEGAPQLTSPMPGTVVLVVATDGARVEVGDPVLVIEAMKMEHQLKATIAGTVSINVAKGAPVKRGEIVAIISPDSQRSDA